MISFSSGPCARHSSWTAPTGILVGRSHRSRAGLEFIKRAMDLQRKVLDIPEDYMLGFVSGSATGGVETLLWNLLGARPIDIVEHCTFSSRWANDIKNELRLPHVNCFRADFPNVADLTQLDFSHDIVFCLSSTTAGLAFNSLDWISDSREGLIICDATSAVFSMKIEWEKLDAVAFSWQKGIGGEAGLASVVLSPNAVKRLEEFSPTHAIPRIFNLKTQGKLNRALFEGATINTPSLLCLEDHYNTLLWADSIGGLPALLQRVQDNYSAVKRFISSQQIFGFLVGEKYRAHHIACFDIGTEYYRGLSCSERWHFLDELERYCEERHIGCDFVGHRETEPHLRLWCGPTIETNQLEAFLAKLPNAYSAVIS